MLRRDPEAYDHYLGNSHLRRFQMMRLPEERRIKTMLQFDFPFYGHPVRKVVVMAEGFVSLPTVMHSNMMETQYIAPLMARFDGIFSNHCRLSFKPWKQILTETIVFLQPNYNFCFGNQDAPTEIT